MSGVTIKWRGDDFIRALPKAIDAGVNEAANVLANAAVNIIGRDHGGVPSKPGQPPNSQKGSLRASIGRTEASGGRAYVGTHLAYGRHLEFGAVVRPRNAKALAIPLNAAARSLLRKYGSPRLAIDAAKAGKRQVRTIPAKGGSVLVISSSRSKAPRDSNPRFFLTKQSVIAPRPWLRPASVRSIDAMRRAFVATASQNLRGAAQ